MRCGGEGVIALGSLQILKGALELLITYPRSPLQSLYDCLFYGKPFMPPSHKP